MFQNLIISGFCKLFQLQMEVLRRNYKTDGLRESWGNYCPIQHGVRDIQKMPNATPSYWWTPVPSSEEERWFSKPFRKVKSVKEELVSLPADLQRCQHGKAEATDGTWWKYLKYSYLSPRFCSPKGKPTISGINSFSLQFVWVWLGSSVSPLGRAWVTWTSWLWTA